MCAPNCWGLYDNNKIIGFCGVLHQPSAHNSKIKRVSRLVILPDYQGIGLGKQFLSTIAEYYYSQGYDFEIITSAKNLIHALYKDKNWNMQRLSKEKTPTNKTAKVERAKTYERKCKTASFFYKR